jgi:hypothetical protein
MFFIYLEASPISEILFAISLAFFVASLFISLLEIRLSTKALEMELSNMEDLKNPSIVEYIKKRFDKE